MYRLRFGAVVVLISLCVVSAAVLLPTALYLSTIPDAPSTAVADLNGTFQPIMSIGRGMITSAFWSQQGDHILLNTDLGAWLYTDTLADLHFFPDLNDANFSPDGRWIVGTMQIADESTQQPIYSASTFEPAGFDTPLVSAAFNPDGELLAALNTNGKFQLWDAHNNAFTPLADNPFPPDMTAFQWSPDGTLLALESGDDTWMIWKLGESQPQFTLPPAEQVILHWSPDSSRFLLDFPDNRLQLWDIDTGSMLYEIPADPRYPVKVEPPPAPDEMYPIYGYYDLIYWRPDDKQWIRKYPYPLVSAHIQVYDTETGQVITEWDEGDHYDLVYAADSKHLITSNAGLIETQTYTAQKPYSNLLVFSWSPDGSRAALPAGLGGLYEIINASTGQVLTTLERTENIAWATSSLWSPDSARILLWGQRHPPAIYNTTTGKKLHQIHEHVRYLKFNVDESRLAIGDETGSIHIWDVASQQLLTRIPGNGLPLVNFDWQPMGTLIATQMDGLSAVTPPITLKSGMPFLDIRFKLLMRTPSHGTLQIKG